MESMWGSKQKTARDKEGACPTPLGHSNKAGPKWCLKPWKHVAEVGAHMPAQLEEDNMREEVD